MPLSEDLAILNQVETFRELGDDKLRLIAFGAERRRIQAGQVLFRQNSPADCAFVVAAGSFELTRAGKHGHPVSLGTVGVGTMLGEMALISPVDRTMTAIAAEPSEVIRIHRPLFHRMLDEYPEIGDLLRRRIAENLRRMLREIERLAPRFAD